MMIANLATMWCKEGLLALTAMERWAAAKQLRTDTSVVPTWLIVAVAVGVIILAVSALVNRYTQRPR